MLDDLITNKRIIRDDLVIVSPDYGSVKRTRSIASKINCDFAIIDKNRVGQNKVESSEILGNVDNKNCLIFDDIIDTGGTIIQGCKILKEKGAKSIDIVATHGLLNKNCIANFIEANKNGLINKVYITDTIQREEKLPDFFSVISIAELISSAVSIFAHGKHCISSVYEKYSFFKFFE
jgi:ribose-phosphate pyrophosphokinase